MHNILLKNGPVFVPVFLYAVTMLIFQIKRIISSEKWLHYVVTCFLFFEKAKNVGRSDDDKRRKKRGWPNKYARQISEKSLEQKSVAKSCSNSSCEIVLQFQK